jgi:hypothetical protein
MSVKPEAAARERISEQAFLMLRLDTILNLTNGSVVNNNGLVPPYPMDRKKMQYLHFSCIRDDSSGHFNLTNNLTKNKNMSYLLKKIPPQFLSALIPSIKLFKVFYQPTGNNTKNLAYNEFHWRIPFDDSSTKTNRSSEFVENAIQDVLNFHGRLNGAGIKSFNYNYLGVNPADINSNISAELDIYFQSIHDLVKKINVLPTDTRFGTKKPTNSSWKSTFSYSDLVSISSRTVKQTTSPVASSANVINQDQVPNEHYYRLKAVLGYANLDNSYYLSLAKAANLSKTELDAIKDAIVTSEVVLMLTPVSHDIKFNEDSSLNLKIQYQASLDSILYSNESDILKMGNTFSNVKDLRKKINNLLLLKNQEVDKLKQDVCEDPEEIERLITELTNDPSKPFSQAAIDNYRKELYVQEKGFYDGFIKTLLGIKSYNGIGNRRGSIGVYEIDVRPFDLGFDYSRGGFFDDEQSNAELAGLRLNALKNTIVAKVFKQLKFTSAQSGLLDNAQNDILPTEAELTSKLFGVWTGDLPADEGISEKISEKINEKSEDLLSKIGAGIAGAGAQSSGAANVLGETSPLKFIFLGDILDIALDVVFSNDDQTSNNIRKFIPIVGPMKIGIPTTQIRTGSKYTAIGDDTKVFYVSLADIPISLNLFTNFLFEKIIKTHRETYPFGVFIKDIISELVFPAISPTYLGRSKAANGYSTTNNTHIRFSTLNLTVPLETTYANANEEDKKDPLLKFPINFNKSSGLTYPSLDQQAINNLKNLNLRLNKSNNSTIDYFIIFCSSQFPANLYNGIEKDDNEKGIFHFRLGTDSGIIKSINFSKTDSPFYREALAHQEGMQNAHMLRQVYDAEIKLFGNNIYRPGDIIYIESVYSIPGREVELEVLNIDGYYMITKINTSFSENIFETTLTCVKKAFVKRTQGVDTGKSSTQVIEENERCVKT